MRVDRKAAAVPPINSVSESTSARPFARSAGALPELQQIGFYYAK
jgi:hypothetical protein